MPRPLVRAFLSGAATLAVLTAGVPADAAAQARALTGSRGPQAPRVPLEPCPTPPATSAQARPDSAADRSPTAPPNDPGNPSRDAGAVDIAFIASASAASITFAAQPEVRVRLCGGLDSIRVVERRNLPQRIVPGRTYRDVFVAVEILGRIDAACLTERLRASPVQPAGMADSIRAGDCAGVTMGTIRSPQGRSP